MKMYKMKLMNKISSVGTALFNQDYLVGEDQKATNVSTPSFSIAL